MACSGGRPRLAFPPAPGKEISDALPVSGGVRFRDRSWTAVPRPRSLPPTTGRA